MILLDTCVLLWLASDASEISEPALDSIAGLDESVFVSPITAFEIGQKCASGKLTLPKPIQIWFPAILKRHQLSEASFNSAIAMRASQLPPLHKDLFDRLLIATAIENRYTLLTPDQHIRQYPGIATLW